MVMKKTSEGDEASGTKGRSVYTQTGKRRRRRCEDPQADRGEEDDGGLLWVTLEIREQLLRAQAATLPANKRGSEAMV